MTSKAWFLIYWFAITLGISATITATASSSAHLGSSCDPNAGDATQNESAARSLVPHGEDVKPCLMYDICDHEAGLPCKKDNHTPWPLYPITEAGRFCSNVLSETSETFGVCCNSKQIAVLTQLLYMPESLLGKCPSCFNNLARALCLISCSANQSEWLEVSTTSDVAVTGVTVYISPEYANEVYESCENVNLVVTGRPMTDHLCGQNENSTTCSAEKWFAWIGEPANGLTKFGIEFVFGAMLGGTTAFSDRHSECYQAPHSQAKACTCDDCPGSCFVTEEPTTEWDLTPSTEEPTSGADVMRQRAHFPVAVIQCLINLLVFANIFCTENCPVQLFA